jgi:hypothetical protein
MDWHIFLQSLFGTALGSGAVLYLAKQMLSHTLNRDLERLRVDLKMGALEREIRFRSLFDKQAEVFSETYSLLNELFYKVGMLTTCDGDTKRSERAYYIEEADDAIINFRSFFYPKRLYFPEDTGNKINDFYRRLRDRAIAFESALKEFDKSKTDTNLNKLKMQNKELVEAEPGVLALIRADFQQLIGFERNVTSST